MPADGLTPPPADFDVALSFAGEDRELAHEIAVSLAARGIKVFYDGFFKADLWGKDLFQHLADIYEKRAQYCVMLVSEHYVRKNWTTHEARNAQARALAQGSEYILPIRIDESRLAGLPETVAYLSARENSVAEIVDLIVEKIHGESDSSLRMRAERVEAQLWEKARNGIRFACSACGMEWRWPDNIHFCLYCQTVYCYQCVHALPPVRDATEFKWKCRCGGRVA